MFFGLKKVVVRAFWWVWGLRTVSESISRCFWCILVCRTLYRLQNFERIWDLKRLLQENDQMFVAQKRKSKPAVCKSRTIRSMKYTQGPHPFNFRQRQKSSKESNVTSMGASLRHIHWLRIILELSHVGTISDATCTMKRWMMFPRCSEQ